MLKLNPSKIYFENGARVVGGHLDEEPPLAGYPHGPVRAAGGGQYGFSGEGLEFPADS